MNGGNDPSTGCRMKGCPGGALNAPGPGAAEDGDGPQE